MNEPYRIDTIDDIVARLITRVEELESKMERIVPGAGPFWLSNQPKDIKFRQAVIREQ